MQGFVAFLDGGEDLVPLAFDIGAIGMQVGFQSVAYKDFMTGGDIGRNRHPDIKRRNGQIDSDVNGKASHRDGF